MKIGNRILTAACVLASLAGSVLITRATAAPAAPRADDTLARFARVENFGRPYPWLWTGGQPDAEALAGLAKAGVVDVFDLRGTDEARNFDERAVAEAMGLTYLPIPTGPGDFDDAKFTALRHHLIAHGPSHPMFIHCLTGNRVGAALLPWLVLDRGMTQDAALKMARELGLDDQDLTERALEYIRTHPATRR